MSLSKKEIRKNIKETLSRFDSKSLKQKGERVSVNVLSLLRERLPKFNPQLPLKYLIGGFSPFEHEPNWLKNTELTNYNDRFSFPCIKDGKMTFAKCDPGNLVESMEFGVNIFGPPVGSAQVIPDIILIPGLGFTAKGDRLGRGKGHFDKYLSLSKGIKVGVCFEEQIISDLPTEPHDEQVDFIVSDIRIIEVKK